MHCRRQKFISLSLSSLLLISSWSVALAQTPPAPASAPQDDVLRISTDLVQTDLVVLDKKGNNVKDLTKDQFELLVDGQRQNISFFESVNAGSMKEAAQLATARESAAGGTTSATSVSASAPGRSFIFFVDDYHLSAEGVQRTTDLLKNFIGKMGDDDRALLMSPSGQIGFLQQLTDHKGALNLAISRIKYQAQAVPFSTSRRPMTIYEALAIERNQRDMIEYKTKEYMDEMGLSRVTATPVRSSSGPGIEQPRNPGTDVMARQMTAETTIKSEARNIVAHANQVNEALLGSLEYVTRGAGTLPGRKLFFLISDGFLIDTRHAKSTERFNRIIDTAARSGVAIYTVDSKGLTAGGINASQDALPDLAVAIAQGPTYQSSGTNASTSSLASDSATKDVLRTIAADTGGRAILNRNDLEAGINQILRETESYYVLAWKPLAVEAGKPKFSTLAVTVKGRPELRVLARKGFFTTSPQPIPEETKPAAKDSKAANLKPSELELRAALTAAFPRKQLGLSSYTTFTNESGPNYKVITFADISRAGATKGEVDFYVTLLDSTGKSVTSVGQKLAVAENSQPSRVTTTLPNTVPPGLYQVRVAARDVQSGRIGSSFQWIEVPPFEAGKLTASNILLAEVTGKPGETPVLDVDRRFARTSSLLIQMFVYNAKPSAAGAPDVSVTLQVLRNGKQVVAAPPQPISSVGVTDAARLPYAAEIPLSRFEPGRYTLKATADDRTAKTSTSQQINISIE